jgi:hypothetical protein
LTRHLTRLAKPHLLQAILVEAVGIEP